MRKEQKKLGVYQATLRHQDPQARRIETVMDRWRSTAIWVLKASVQQLAIHRIHLHKTLHIPCKAQKRWADAWSTLGTDIMLKELRLPHVPRKHQPTQDCMTNQCRSSHKMGPAELQRWKKWAGTILETTSELSHLQKMRTRKWDALNVQLWCSKMRDEVVDGLTGCLYINRLSTKGRKGKASSLCGYRVSS